MPFVERQGRDIESGGSPKRRDQQGSAVDDSSDDSTHREVQIFGLKLRGLPSWALYLILASMVFILSLSAAYCAELVFIQAGTYDISWFLALFELGLGTFLSSAHKLTTKAQRRGSFVAYAFLGALFLAARVLTNLSVEYMDYPTHVVIKSAKVVPMMVMGFFILGKRYSFLEYVSATLLITGISVFMLANKAASPKFDSLSLAIGGFALLVDSLVGNNQEKMMKHENVSATEVVHYMNVFGFGYCVIFVLLSGNIFKSIEFCSTTPTIYIPMVLCGALSYFALSFITTIVQEFGTVVCVMTTSCRKVFTVVLSYVFFPKVLVFNHFVGGAIMTLAISVEVFVKTRGGPHH